MKGKVHEKNRVMELRKKGFTYSQILKQVSVSKSSVSAWLKDFPLTDTEKNLLRERKGKDISRWRLRAGATLRRAKEQRDAQLYEIAKVEFSQNIDNPLFQLGIGLYWAEGAKRSTSFGFMNSDSDMIVLMIRWIKIFLKAVDEEVKLRVFTHQAFSGEGHENYWSEKTRIPLNRFTKTIYKSHNGLIVKKRPNYKGCVRIELGKVNYLRKMKFWQQMLIEYYEKQG